MVIEIATACQLPATEPSEYLPETLTTATAPAMKGSTTAESTVARPRSIPRTASTRGGISWTVKATNTTVAS
ncbi:hypothetical protein AHiyo8_50650 [Arthrobacter sp. Hiyo8]|nr:hypothetical protein AHiyo8_50650 [Arthrobacter sp. Hiyo8]